MGRGDRGFEPGTLLTTLAVGAGSGLLVLAVVVFLVSPETCFLVNRSCPIDEPCAPLPPPACVKASSDAVGILAMSGLGLLLAAVWRPLFVESP